MNVLHAVTMVTALLQPISAFYFGNVEWCLNFNAANSRDVYIDVTSDECGVPISGATLVQECFSWGAWATIDNVPSFTEVSPGLYKYSAPYQGHVIDVDVAGCTSSSVTIGDGTPADNKAVALTCNPEICAQTTSTTTSSTTSTSTTVSTTTTEPATTSSTTSDVTSSSTSAVTSSSTSATTATTSDHGLTSPDTPAGFGDINYPCTAGSDCTTEHSDCRNGVICECVAGYSYLDYTRQCVRECPNGYGDTFHETKGWYVIGNDITQDSNFNIEDCKQKCLDNPECRSIDFDTWFEVCRTSNITKYGHEADWYHDHEFVSFERNCVSMVAAPSTTTMTSSVTSSPTGATSTSAFNLPLTTPDTPAGPGDINYPCTTGSDCSTKHSDCRNGVVCECVAGYIYLDYTRQCVRSCPNGYGDTWSETKEWFVAGNDVTVDSNYNVEDCKQKCLDNPECRSIEFDTFYGKCRTSNVTKYGYDSDWQYDFYVVTYERNCAPLAISTVTPTTSPTTSSISSSTTSTTTSTSTSTSTSTTASTTYSPAACTTDSDCTTDNSDCRNGEICECEAGYSYLSLTGQCVTTCPNGYGDTFHETKEWYVIGNDITQDSNFNIEDCKQKCLDNPECRSIDFDTWFEVCRTSNITKYGHEADWYNDIDFVSFERNCA